MDEDQKDLFVAEDEEPQQASTQVSEEPESSESPDVSMHDAEEYLDTDPIVRSIPIVHGQLPQRHAQTLHVLQFPGRPEAQSFESSCLTASVKPESKVLQLQIPVDTKKFYSETRAAELGGNIANVSLQGVLCDAGGGLFAGRIVEKDGQKRLVIVPLDSTAQLRASFKHLDDRDTARVQQIRADAQPEDQAPPSAVQVLQTAAKANNQSSNEGHHAGGVGSCLRHMKKFQEEEWGALSWCASDDSSSQGIVEKMQDANNEVVAVSTVLDELLA